jgi:hypothetical protein
MGLIINIFSLVKEKMCHKLLFKSFINCVNYFKIIIPKLICKKVVINLNKLKLY